jgi:hypothetical protein
MVEKKKMCKFCEKKIDLSVDKYVLLGTYEGDDIKDESYFHFPCFVTWYNGKVLDKAKNSVQVLQDNAKQLFALLEKAGFLNNVAGIEQLKDKLGIDLNNIPDITQVFGKEEDNEIITSEPVKEKKQTHGRRNKKSGKNRKEKMQ